MNKEIKEIKELKKEIKNEKDIKYLVKVTNLEDRGQNLQFLFQNKYYDLPDGKEVELKKAVIDHLNKVVLVETKLNIVNGKEQKEKIERNRVMCTIIKKIED